MKAAIGVTLAFSFRNVANRPLVLVPLLSSRTCEMNVESMDWQYIVDTIRVSMNKSLELCVRKGLPGLGTWFAEERRRDSGSNKRGEVGVGAEVGDDWLDEEEDMAWGKGCYM